MPATDIADSGWWNIAVYGTSLSFQIDFYLDEGIGYLLHGALLEPPGTITLDNNGVYTYRYVKAPVDGG